VQRALPGRRVDEREQPAVATPSLQADTSSRDAPGRASSSGIKPLLRMKVSETSIG